ncbi:hypothetical protein TWF718_004996 [Orbilia javanica]|uniref:Uncharacterized protein n=1 Tax=Orbilia javanica TaxID=47235 RepID=A0AAN8RFY9_9PEZI
MTTTPLIRIIGHQGHYDYRKFAGIDFDYNHKRIVLTLHASDTTGDPNSPCQGTQLEERLINQFHDEMTHDNIVQTIIDHGKDFFSKIPPLELPIPPERDLHSVLLPETFHVEFKMIDGEPAVIQIDTPEIFPDHITLDPDIDRIKEEVGGADTTDY